MHCTLLPPPGHALRSVLAKCTVIALLAAAMAGCEAPPRDTSKTPAPPRLPIAADDDVFPDPTTVRDPRAPAAPAPK